MSSILARSLESDPYNPLPGPLSKRFGSKACSDPFTLHTMPLTTRTLKPGTLNPKQKTLNTQAQETKLLEANPPGLLVQYPRGTKVRG